MVTPNRQFSSDYLALPLTATPKPDTARLIIVAPWMIMPRLSLILTPACGLRGAAGPGVSDVRFGVLGVVTSGRRRSHPGTAHGLPASFAGSKPASPSQGDVKLTSCDHL